MDIYKLHINIASFGNIGRWEEVALNSPDSSGVWAGVGLVWAVGCNLSA